MILQLLSLKKQDIRETIKPINETPSPNAVAVPLEVNISAIPKSEMEIPKSDKRILSLPFNIIICHKNEISFLNYPSPT